MPIEKYRSIEEMNAAPIRSRRDDGFDRFVRHCARFWKLAPRRYPRGVMRFRSYEDAQATPTHIRED
jgi:hypothetical protein